MKKTLLIRAQPGNQEVQVLSDRNGNPITPYVACMRQTVWEQQGEPVKKERMIRKYIAVGLPFSKERRSRLAKRSRNPTYKISPVQEAALQGQYETIVTSLIKHLP